MGHSIVCSTVETSEEYFMAAEAVFNTACSQFWPSLLFVLCDEKNSPTIFQKLQQKYPSSIDVNIELE